MAATLCEALEAVLPADVVYLCEAFAGRDGLAVLRVAGETLEGARREPWAAFLRACEGQVRSAQTLVTPLGPLRVARAQMSLAEPRVTLWVGSRAPRFPGTTQAAYVAAAASLASTGLQSARLAAEREQAHRTKDDFLAMLAHELRNPLAPISNALAMLALKGLPEVDYERQILARQVRQLSRLVDDLIDVSRVARGKIELRLQAVPLETLVRDALEAVQPLIAQKAHVLSLDLPAGPLAVRGDPARLQQILANLLNNAAKYTDPGGSIVLRAAREGSRLRLSVADSGIGLEPELVPRVFDLFTQGRRGPDRAAGGLGVGLALVKSLAELHGGRVAAHSDGPGRGSTFTAWLPLAPPEARPAAPPRVQVGPRRVLVVDDNVDAASSLALLLRMHGHDVRVAHDPAEALAQLERFEADVALLDIGLPLMDGYALARRIRERLGRHAPRLIALSGYGQAEDRAKSAQAGLAHHLTKPVEIESLLSALA